MQNNMSGGRTKARDNVKGIHACVTSVVKIWGNFRVPGREASMYNYLYLYLSTISPN